MTNNNIPDWLMTSEGYEPLKDNATFIDKSTKSVMRLMSSFKLNSNNYKAKGANTSIRLFGVLLLIILTAVSRNFSFVLFMVAVAIVRVATLSSERIRALLKVLAPALVISFLILVPSVFLGNPKTPALVLSKIIVSVSLVMALNLTTSFNEITRSLKLFHVPDVVIFTLDLTIKYIILLAEACGEMLSALKLRSIGKNKDKRSSVSGILGTVFVKAKASADATAKAMECRGFNGKYVVIKKTGIKPADIFYILLLCAVIGVFVYLEVIL